VIVHERFDIWLGVILSKNTGFEADGCLARASMVNEHVMNVVKDMILMNGTYQWVVMKVRNCNYSQFFIFKWR
jgi:hypothetical protein